MPPVFSDNGRATYILACCEEVTGFIELVGLNSLGTVQGAKPLYIIGGIVCIMREKYIYIMAGKYSGHNAGVSCLETFNAADEESSDFHFGA